MFSKHGYSPARSSLLSKSRSQGEFYRQATQRSQNQPAADCLACRHEQQLPCLPLRTHLQPSEYYSTAQEPSEVDNLRKAKRFLEELLERQKQEHRQALGVSETKWKRVGEELAVREEELRQLRTANQQQQAQIQQMGSSKLVSASLIRSYAALPEQEEEDDRRYRKARELGKRIDKLEEQLEEAKQELAN